MSDLLKRMWEHTRVSSDPCCEYLYFQSDNDSFTFVFGDDKTIICFNGTDDVRDWIENFNIDKTLNSNDLHDGFETAFIDIYREYHKYFTRAIFYNNPIYIIGHSRGGALAKICTYYLHKYLHIGKDLLNCITFGAPKVGGKKFREYIQRSDIYMTEIVNKCDPVPPLPYKIFGYRHSGNLHYVKPKWYHHILRIRAHLQYGRCL